MAQTIYALATAAGRAAVAVIRVSGPRAADAVRSLAGKLPAPRRADYVRLRDAQDFILDYGLVLWFPGPQSFTGEDCAEFQIHGARSTISAVLAALGQVEGLRVAEPGEFSRRAFLNGKMDLAQAEGLADLIDSETEGQRRQAVRQLEGVLGKALVRWQDELLHLRALVEADLDFSDEGDVNALPLRQIKDSATKLIGEIDQALAGYQRARYIQNGFQIAIIGAPNVGKSSLLNYLAGRDAAIVSDEAGTTRDLVQVTLNIGQIPVILTDTAGIRETDQHVEKLGIERAQKAAADADLVLYLTDGTHEKHIEVLTTPVLRVQTKQDIQPHPLPNVDLMISVHSGFGLHELKDRLKEYLDAVPQGSGLITRERHMLALQACKRALADVVACDSDSLPELISEDLRAAAFELGRIVGHYGVEDVLGTIFSTFCIGK